MKRIYLLAAILLAPPGMALELAYMALENNRANQIYATELAEHLNADSAVTVPIIELETFVREAANRSEPTVIELPPELGQIAIQSGWVQTHVSMHKIAIGLYRAAGQTSPIQRVSSTPPNTLAHSSLSHHAPAAEYVQAGSHTQCLRRLFDGSADACASPVAFAQRYAERFNLELDRIGEPLLTDPVGLYANAQTSQEQIDQLRSKRIELSRGSVFTGYTP